MSWRNETAVNKRKYQSVSSNSKRRKLIAAHQPEKRRQRKQLKGSAWRQQWHHRSNENGMKACERKQWRENNLSVSGEASNGSVAAM
jgi:hypothetical protein